MKEGIKLLKFVLIRKVRTKNVFNIAILRYILYFKLTVNSHTHLRTWKTDKKRNPILPQSQRETSILNSS